MDAATELRLNTINAQPEKVQAEVLHLRELLEARLHAMDEATKLLATNVDKVPYAILQEAGNLKALIMAKIEEVSHVSDEKFRAIDGTFASNALALTAALAAQKEAAAEQNKSNTLAITKSEQAQKETVGANQAQTTAGLAAQAAAHQDLKERVVRLEAGGLGRTEGVANQRALVADKASSTSANMAILGAVFVGLSLLIGIVALVISLKP